MQTAEEEARELVERWREELWQEYKWDCIIPDESVAVFVARLVPLCERARVAQEIINREHNNRIDEYMGWRKRAERAEAQMIRWEHDLSEQVERRTKAEAEVERLRAEVAYYEREEAAEDSFSRAQRESVNAMMREALGPEMYSRLWGTELERLGKVCDALWEERDAARAQVARLVEVLRETGYAENPCQQVQLGRPMCVNVEHARDGCIPCVVRAALAEGKR